MSSSLYLLYSYLVGKRRPSPILQRKEVRRMDHGQARIERLLRLIAEGRELGINLRALLAEEPRPVPPKNGKNQQTHEEGGKECARKRAA